MCNSPMSVETSGRSRDANQDEMMEKSAQEWNEQLEKEFFSGKCVSLLCSDTVVTRSGSGDWFQRFFSKSIGCKDMAHYFLVIVATFCWLHLTAECLTLMCHWLLLECISFHTHLVQKNHTFKVYISLC